MTATIDRRVLVVEDDEGTRNLLIQALQEEGYNPIGAENGQQALDIVAREEAAGRQPAVVLLDLYMPLMDGVGFARAYREQTRLPAPIVLLTASTPTPDLLADVCAAAFIRKPFDLDLLFGSVRDAAGAVGAAGGGTAQGPTALRVLLVEDSAADARLVAEVLRELPGIELETASDGSAGLRALERASGSGAHHHLLLLDLGLPRLDGFTVLEAVKRSPALRRLPVVVITGSEDTQDVVRAYDAHANGYVVKSGDLEVMRQRIAGTIRFWQLARLPRVTPSAAG